MKRIQNFIMRPYRAIATACVLVLIVSLMAGCSTARLAYSNGATLSYWWLDKYVAFDSRQSPFVKTELANLFSWHRKTQLPEYVQFLKRAQTRAQKPASEAELRNDYDYFKKHMLVLTDRALPVLAELALSLSPDQIDHIQKKFAENDDDYRKSHLRGNVEKRQRHRYKKALQQAENWFGGFTPDQERQIRAISDARPLNNELVLADRMQRQAATIALLKNIQSGKPSREVAMTMIRNHIVASLERPFGPEHKEFFGAFRASSIHMIAAIINGTTPAQKVHFVTTTQRWIDDFTALAS
jgi:hypothetical protein